MALALLATLGSVAWADPVEVIVQVRDAQGRVAAGAEVATMWQMKGGEPVPAEGAAHAKTAADGLARMKLDRPGGPLLVSAYDATRENAGLVVLAPSSTKLEIHLRPVAKITQSLRVKGEDPGFFPTGGYNLMVEMPNKDMLFWGWGEIQPQNEYILPAGDYVFFMFSPEATGKNDGKLKLEPGQRLRLDPVEMELSLLAKSYGKAAPPLTVTEARGIDRPFRIEDYRGKWVLLEFWGFW
jgi:hypothetical protein